MRRARQKPSLTWHKAFKRKEFEIEVLILDELTRLGYQHRRAGFARIAAKNRSSVLPKRMR